MIDRTNHPDSKQNAGRDGEWFCWHASVPFKHSDWKSNCRRRLGRSGKIPVLKLPMHSA